MITKIKSLFTFLSLAIWLSISCTSATPIPAPAIPPPPTARPTTILNPAAGYTAGICDIPENYYLFLKYSSYMSCSNACDCPEIEPPQPAIDRSEEHIRYNSNQVIGHFEPWDPNDPALGLIIYGWFEELLYVIEDVPFEIPGSGKPLAGCDSTGVAIIEIGGEAFELEPGGGWSSQSVHDRGGGCYETHTISMVNSGLIEKERFISDLSVHDEYVQLEMVTLYFSLEEDISFDVIVSGEDNIDFSDYCPVMFELWDQNMWVEVGSCSNIPAYVPEPFPRQPGDIIEISLPQSTIGIDIPYQYELDVGTYRFRFTYYGPEGYQELYSQQFFVTP